LSCAEQNLTQIFGAHIGTQPSGNPGVIGGGYGMSFDLNTPLNLFFSSRNWALNWLLITVCFLIPVVGPIVAIGYMVRCTAAWIRRKPAPDFDFGLFASYLTQGLWPFLVTTVASLALIPVFMVVPIGTAILLPAMCQTGGGPPAAAFFLTIAAVFVLSSVVMLVWTVLCVPMMLKSGLEQNFAAGFSWPFIRDFIGRVGFFHILFAEFLLLFLMYAAMIVGMLALIVGVYFVTAVFMWVNWHVMYQFYMRYLDCGGTPLTIHPDLYLIIPPPVPEPVPPQVPSGSTGNV